MRSMIPPENELAPFTGGARLSEQAVSHVEPKWHGSAGGVRPTPKPVDHAGKCHAIFRKTARIPGRDLEV